MYKLSGKLLGIILLCNVGLSAAADEPMTEEEIEAWFNDTAEEKALLVNEGSLEFLVNKPERPVHHIHNTFTIDRESLITGWIDLIQCHKNLDAVSATQVEYRYRQIKSLRIESFSGIGRAWIEGSSLQLENIEKGARICVRAQVGILKKLEQNSYILKNGPFHRKFLDGYYPMQVTLNIRYPSDMIDFVSIRPELQKGFTLNKSRGEIIVNALFEGMLMTEVRFVKLSN